MNEADIVQELISLGLLDDQQMSQAVIRQGELADRGRQRTVIDVMLDEGFIARDDLAQARNGVISRADREKNISTSNITIAGYHLKGKIGKGGMGDVFLGVNDRNEEVAVKLLPHRLARDEEYLARFRREVLALGAVHHPHITRFIGEGLHDGRPYLMMEAVRGPSLKEYLVANGALTEPQGRLLMAQMASALASAWQEAGLVHRDIKPANILLGEVGEYAGPHQCAAEDSFCAKLCDFGLGKFRKRTEAGDELTNTGVAVGTPHYMSPEQATGDRTADPRHDIYGLAATVYHALLGKTLYSGGSSAVIMYKQATATLDLRPLQRRGVSAEFVDVINAMLAKPVERRIADWITVQERLQALPAVNAPRKASAISLSSEDMKASSSAESQAGTTLATTRESASKFNPISAHDPRMADVDHVRYHHNWQIVMMTIVVLLFCALIAGTMFLWVTDSEDSAVIIVGAEASVVEAWEDSAHIIENEMIELHLPEQYRLPVSDLDQLLQLSTGKRLAIVADPSSSVKIIGSLPKGLGRVSVHNVEWSSDEELADQEFLLSIAGGEWVLSQCVIHGGIQVSDQGQLRLEQTRVRSATQALEVSGGSVLHLSQVELLAGENALSVHRSHAHAHDVDIIGIGMAATAIEVHNQALVDLQQVDISGWQSGLRVDTSEAQLSRVRIDSVETGIDVNQSVISVCERVAISASKIGMLWRGPHEPPWLWREIGIHAPELVLGMERPTTVMGYEQPLPQW